MPQDQAWETAREELSVRDTRRLGILVGKRPDLQFSNWGQPWVSADPAWPERFSPRLGRCSSYSIGRWGERDRAGEQGGTRWNRWRWRAGQNEVRPGLECDGGEAQCLVQHSNPGRRRVDSVPQCLLRSCLPRRHRGPVRSLRTSARRVDGAWPATGTCAATAIPVCHAASRPHHRPQRALGDRPDSGGARPGGRAFTMPKVTLGRRSCPSPPITALSVLELAGLKRPQSHRTPSN